VFNEGISLFGLKINNKLYNINVGKIKDEIKIIIKK